MKTIAADAPSMSFRTPAASRASPQSSRCRPSCHWSPARLTGCLRISGTSVGRILLRIDNVGHEGVNLGRFEPG